MAAAIPVIGIGASIIGGIQSSREQSKQMENQAVALEAQADALRKEGFAQETAIRGQADAIAGQQIAGAAGSGVMTNTGSVLDVIEDTAYNIELDALTTRANYEREAQATEQGAANYRSAKPSGISTLLGAAGTAASGYAQYQMFK